MNIIFFIGNGFDINLGMKTRYSDFYEYYKNIGSKSNLVKELKEDITSGIENWSDLEIALGKYTLKLKDLDEFDEIYVDIVNNLGDYLTEEESHFDFNKFKKDVFYQDLRYPEDHLSEQEIQELRSYRSNWASQNWHTNIITLNYTRSIEKIFDVEFENLLLGNNEYGNKILLKNIYHIHGYTDKRLVLGLNDLTQVDNRLFHDNEEILESLIKLKCNQVQGHRVDKECERLIGKADLVCIFGSSIGDTDNYWWQLIGDQLRRNCRIIIFYRGDEISARLAQIAVRAKRKIKKLFLDKTNLTDDEKQLYRENIYVGVNANLFNIM